MDVLGLRSFRFFTIILFSAFVLKGLEPSAFSQEIDLGIDVPGKTKPDETVSPDETASEEEEPPELSEKIIELRNSMIEAPSLESLFGDLVREATTQSTKEGLDDWFREPEKLYSDDYVAFRRRVYGPLLDDSTTRDFLRDFVASAGNSGRAGNSNAGRRDQNSPPTAEGGASGRGGRGSGTGGGRGRNGRGRSTTALSAALLLSDAPDVDDLIALKDAYETSWESRESTTTTFARYLGRGLSRFAEPQSRRAKRTIDEAMEMLVSQARVDEPQMAGGALEGLLRAGAIAEAEVVLESVLSNLSDPSKALRTLQAAQRGLTANLVDPEIKQSILDFATQQAESILELPAPRSTFVIATTPESQVLKDSVALHRSLRSPLSVDLLVRCCEDPIAAARLGMDDLQSMRTTFQSMRGDLDSETREKIDNMYEQVLFKAGERIFQMEEEPMSFEEFNEFTRNRDFRYNAAYYFVSLWDTHEDLRERWADPQEAIDYFTPFLRANKEIVEGTGYDAVYSSIKDKIETRILLTQLMMRIETATEVKAEVDFYEEAIKILAEDLSVNLGETVPRPSVSGDLRNPIEISIENKPSDTWVYSRTVETVKELGLIAEESGSWLRISTK